MASGKEMRALIRQAEEAGAEYCGRTRSGHHKMVYRGQPVFLPSTPSCHRSVSNTRALLRRIGVPI